MLNKIQGAEIGNREAQAIALIEAPRDTASRVNFVPALPQLLQY